MVEITENASKQIVKMCRQKRHRGRWPARWPEGRRLFRLRYTFAWEATPRGDDSIDGPHGARVFVDPRSFRLIDGTVLDYDTNLDASRRPGSTATPAQYAVLMNFQRTDSPRAFAASRVSERPTGRMMSTSTETSEQLATRDPSYGFVTDIEADTFPPRSRRGTSFARSRPRRTSPSGCWSGG